MLWHPIALHLTYIPSFHVAAFATFHGIPSVMFSGPCVPTLIKLPMEGFGAMRAQWMGATEMAVPPGDPSLLVPTAAATSEGGTAKLGENYLWILAWTKMYLQNRSSADPSNQ